MEDYVWFCPWVWKTDDELGFCSWPLRVSTGTHLGNTNGRISSCEEHKLSARVVAIQRLLATYREDHGVASINRQVMAGDYKGLCSRNYVKNYQVQHAPFSTTLHTHPRHAALATVLTTITTTFPPPSFF